MKGFKTFAFLYCLTSFYAKSQQLEDSPKIKHHELGIDIYPVAISIFKPDAQGWFGGLPVVKPDYNFTYKYYFKKFAVKARFSINQNHNGETKTTTPSGNITYITIIEAGYDKRLASTFGFQYNFVQNRKSNVFVGIDLLNDRAGMLVGNWSQTYDSTAFSVKINKSHYIAKSSTRVSGLALVFGVSFSLKSNLYFTIESALRYTRSMVKNNYTSYTYQYYEYNAQQQSLYENTTSTDSKIPSSITEFVPTSNFTLSYRF